MESMEVHCGNDLESRTLVVDYLHDLARRVVDGYVNPESIKTKTEYWEHYGIHPYPERIPTHEIVEIRFRIMTENEQWEVLVFG